MQAKSGGQHLLLLKWNTFFLTATRAAWWWSVLLLQMLSEVCLSRASRESMEQRPYWMSLPSILHLKVFISYPVFLCTAARSHLLCGFAICLSYWQTLTFFPLLLYLTSLSCISKLFYGIQHTNNHWSNTLMGLSLLLIALQDLFLAKNVKFLALLK